MNRGSMDLYPDQVAIRDASMRPRFMNRGSAGDGEAFTGIRVRFNEAPIHESGKFHPVRVFGRPQRGFNEAPIHESGKSARFSPKRATF